MNARELRNKYIEFFESKGHLKHQSAPLVPIDVTGKLDQSLLFTGAGMVQFKPYFRALAEPPSKRLVTSQKCVRAKDIEEVGNPAHLTFFEMLGNFSFGDYFKATAIDCAWEFLTSSKWLGLNPDMLCVTVFEEDDEAFELWAAKWSAAGFEPSERLFRLGEQSNFWPAGALSEGPPGPCGPCSEIFYRTVPSGQMSGDFSIDEGAGKWLEIWNLVFMQFEWIGALRDVEKPQLGYVKKGMEPLPQLNIDTGMGLERTARVLGGFSTVYETDVFSPIISAICGLASHLYGSDATKDRAANIIADHIRTAAFCIADGILPSNTGRGYVLRRLIRRSVLKGRRVLSIEEPFMASLVASVQQALADPYVDLIHRQDSIRTTLHDEEEAFLKTMRQGHAMFEEILEEKTKIDGRDAFFLYDTFGFPFEVTQELANERGYGVDEDEYRVALVEAQERSRSAKGAADVFGGDADRIILAVAPDAPAITTFVGYDRIQHATRLVQISPLLNEHGLTNGKFQICLEETPFFAESGGQVGDTGVIEADEFSFYVTNTWREMGMVWHDADLVRFPKEASGLAEDEIGTLLQTGVFFAPVLATVDGRRRLDIMRNHTATHLLHAALRSIVGTHVTQAGSLVAPDRLRFDFTHRQALSDREVYEIERQVNEQIANANQMRIHYNVPIEDARKLGAMMLFGEKYGDYVRVVEVPGYSLELCGGTHVNNVAEIGLFKITSEASSASGVRRIEAVTGFGAYEHIAMREKYLTEASLALKTPITEIPSAIARLQKQLKDAKKLAPPPAGGDFEISATQVGELIFKASILKGSSPEEAKSIVDRMVATEPMSIGFAALIQDGKVSFFCKVGKEALKKGAHAGDIVKAAAIAAGGGGGGSPAFAQAGGRDSSKTDEALKAAVAAIDR